MSLCNVWKGHKSVHRIVWCVHTSIDHCREHTDQSADWTDRFMGSPTLFLEIIRRQPFCPIVPFERSSLKSFSLKPGNCCRVPLCKSEEDCFLSELGCNKTEKARNVAV